MSRRRVRLTRPPDAVMRTSSASASPPTWPWVKTPLDTTAPATAPTSWRLSVSDSDSDSDSDSSQVGAFFPTAEECGPEMDQAFEDFGLPETACLFVVSNGVEDEYCAPLDVD